MLPRSSRRLGMPSARTLIRSVVASAVLLATAVAADAAQPRDVDDPFGRPVTSRATLKEAPASFSIFFEQDGVLPWVGPWGGDQNYTMGLGFNGTGSWV